MYVWSINPAIPTPARITGRETTQLDCPEHKHTIRGSMHTRSTTKQKSHIVAVAAPQSCSLGHQYSYSLLEMPRIDRAGSTLRHRIGCHCSVLEACSSVVVANSVQFWHVSFEIVPSRQRSSRAIIAQRTRPRCVSGSEQSLLASTPHKTQAQRTTIIYTHATMVVRNWESIEWWSLTTVLPSPPPPCE